MIPHPVISDSTLLAVEGIKDKDGKPIICGLPQHSWLIRQKNNYGITMISQPALVALPSIPSIDGEKDIAVG